MRYPNDLKQGGQIGFPAPSCGNGYEPYFSAFNNGLKNFKDLGFKVNPGPNAYKQDGIGISTIPEDCGKELTDMYLDEANDVLISCAGGELMCEILEYVDFEKIKEATPKWYMGFSDNTHMTYLMATICDTASIYGPCAGSFGMEPWHEAIQDALDLLTGKKRIMHSYGLWEKDSFKNEENPLVPYNVTEPLEMKVYDQGELFMDPEKSEVSIQMEGRLLGGCMDCLVNLLGTEFDHTEAFLEKYKEDGIIWFLEACDLNVFSIRRAMWQMEKAGWFKYVKGFMFGRPANGDFVWTLDRYQAVLKVASKYNVPVIMDMDIGHMSPMMPLVVGSMAKVNLSGNSVSIAMEYK